ncbi:tail associated lysozyme [Vibrio phage YC]|uniref:Tail associated lysozyme n=1 Tax=Vibrio phage YC TaxID=2267403 RepID=A0A384ZRW9_9CAUD|nr:baseplate hub subunit and tail lysozyme [Vibrio phage YC]AXC34387.1 tail associated lysozyme [Vibrio phage YC]
MLSQPIWFYGIVENIDDPNENGSVQVRVHGAHHPDKAVLETRYLPWAKVMLPPTGSSETTGRSPTGLEVGAEVCGISLDESYDDLRVLFTWHGKDDDVNDVNILARGGMNTAMEDKKSKLQSSEGTGTTWSEPFHDYTKSKYPHNDVDVTRGGHVLEVDNTSGSERIHTYHKSGTYNEMQATGDMVTSVAADEYRVNKIDLNEWIGRHSRRVVEGSATTRFKGHQYVSTEGGMTYVTTGGTLFTESDLFEIVSPILKQIGEMLISQKLTVPKIYATDIFVDNLSVLNMKLGEGKADKMTVTNLDAVATNALQAAKASALGGSISSVNANAGAEGGNVPEIVQTIEDNKGENTNE